MYALCREAADVLAARWGTRRFAPPSMTAAMALVQLPSGGPVPPAGGATSAHARDVQDKLHHARAVECPVKAVDGALYVRISAHIYNRLADYEALAAAVEALAADAAAVATAEG